MTAAFVMKHDVPEATITEAALPKPNPVSQPRIHRPAVAVPRRSHARFLQIVASPSGRKHR